MVHGSQIDTARAIDARATRELAARIIAVVLADEQGDGCDLSAGLFGPNLSALVMGLASRGQSADELAAAARAMVDAFGGNVPDWIAGEYGVLAQAVDQFDQQAELMKDLPADDASDQRAAVTPRG